MTDQQDDDHNKWNIPNWPQFIVSVATLIGVGAYTFYSSSQVSETQIANAIAKQAHAEVNKPYVMLNSLSEPITEDNNGLHKHVGINWTNFGNTPAIHGVWYMCKPIIRDNPTPFPYKCDLLETPQQFPVIGPRQTASMIGPIVSDADLEATLNEKKLIYVFGYFKYEDKIDIDALNIPKLRVTSFCQRIVQQKVYTSNEQTAQLSGPPVSNPPFVGLGCPNFDYCIDEDCKALPE
ncbi:MAG: hypothetical protein ABR863_05790 [Roseiarcus sp.]|jgi:hypothetical protein